MRDCGVRHDALQLGIVFSGSLDCVLKVRQIVPSEGIAADGAAALCAHGRGYGLRVDAIGGDKRVDRRLRLPLVRRRNAEEQTSRAYPLAYIGDTAISKLNARTEISPEKGSEEKLNAGLTGRSDQAWE